MTGDQSYHLMVIAIGTVGRELMRDAKGSRHGKEDYDSRPRGPEAR
jgi:hypothetical protein